MKIVVVDGGQSTALLVKEYFTSCEFSRKYTRGAWYLGGGSALIFVLGILY